MSAAVSAEQVAVGDFALPEADVVLLGELHDNPTHHAWQAELLAQMTPSAVVYEMLTPEQAALITPALRGDRAALVQALNWAETGWPDFAMYHPLMLATDAPIYGAALPRETVRAAVFGDAAALFGDQAARFGLTQPLDPAEQAAREQMQNDAHCNAMPAEMMPGMVAAQRLRDAAFSRTTLEALAAHGGPVAVITGNGHARLDWGMPVYLKAAAPEVRVLSIGQLEAPPDAPPPFDVWTIAPAPERDDPCAAFQ